MAKKRAKTTAEAFIAAVMRHKDGIIQDIADELGVTHQAVSKRLREYRAKGIEGLPEFGGMALDVDGVQKLVNKYRRK
ncbi:MAG: helix-turn-helix domain-containing protein [Betaproteobacteria bacterium]|nr:helix-turn-helix domain-containing protein [Betaproteobacteria bacterium]